MTTVIGGTVGASTRTFIRYTAQSDHDFPQAIQKLEARGIVG
jgi:hypothetical protein